MRTHNCYAFTCSQNKRTQKLIERLGGKKVNDIKLLDRIKLIDSPPQERNNYLYEINGAEGYKILKKIFFKNSN